MSFKPDDRVVFIASGRRGTVLRNQVLVDRVEVGFDAPPSEDPQWIWEDELRPLSIVEMIGDLDA